VKRRVENLDADVSSFSIHLSLYQVFVLRAYRHSALAPAATAPVEATLIVEPAVNVPALPLIHSKISPSHGVAGRLTASETLAAVDTSEAVEGVRPESGPEVKAVVLTPCEVRI